MLLGVPLLARARGCSPVEAVPPGYRLSVLGAAIFAAGGVADLLWHALFGIEVDLEALLSPAHLILGLGGGLIVTGPLRSVWGRRVAGERASWSACWPALFSLLMLLGLLSMFTAYANPLAYPWAAAGVRMEPADVGRALGSAGILLYAGELVGVVLLAVRAGVLPPGGLTGIITGDAVLLVVPHRQLRFVFVAVLAGLLADLLLHRWLLAAMRPDNWRGFAAAVPASYFALYFLVLALTGGVGWSVSLWAGVVLAAAAVGWLVGSLVPSPGAAYMGGRNAEAPCVLCGDLSTGRGADAVGHNQDVPAAAAASARRDPTGRRGA